MGLLDEKPYTLPWLRQYRRSVVAKMEELARRKRETPEMKRKRALLAKLMERVQKLSKEVRGGCPHLIENQKYTETGREDTLGNWKSGMDYKIQCNGCGEVLARWED